MLEQKIDDSMARATTTKKRGLGKTKKCLAVNQLNIVGYKLANRPIYKVASR